MNSISNAKLRYATFLIILIFGLGRISSFAQPTNQAWLNASRLATGFVPSYVAGTNDATTATNGMVLTRRGNKMVWETPPGAGAGLGTVTSVGLSMPSVFDVSSSPVTTSGTLTVVGHNSTGFLKDTAGTLSYTLDLTAATDLNATSLTSGTVPVARIPDPLKLGTFQATTDAQLNSIVLTNEQRIVQAAWGNGPTGAYDCSVPLQTYTITANAAASSLSNTRTATFANYSELNITNSQNSDFTFTWSASGVTTPDGLRTYTATNHQVLSFKVETSGQGVWVLPIHHL